MSRPSLSIIIPALNEAERTCNTLDKPGGYLKQYAITKVEIYD